MIDLHLGDCLSILPTLPDRSMDAIITDLPYGTTACKWDVIIPLVPMWEQVKRLCKGAFVTTASQPFTTIMVSSNLDWFKYEWIWNKVATSSGFMVHKAPARSHENILVFSKNGHTYNPQKEHGIKWSRGGTRRQAAFTGSNIKGEKCKPDADDLKFPKSIIEISNADKTNNFHPTQKPVALYEYLIRTYTNEGDTVMDFCMGSGTTGVACVKTGRNFIGIEREPNYYEITQRRIAEAQQQIPLPLAEATPCQ